VAQGNIVEQVAPPFYDSKNAASYYRIKDGKIEGVLPDVAKSWGWKR
jgi:hypothetical protein